MTTTATELVGLRDIADRLGYAESTVYQWHHRGQLPAPDYVISRTHPAWWWDTIQEWWDDET